MKKIQGLENYLISKFGDVYSLYSNKCIKSRINKKGYNQIILYKNNKPITKTIHRLVALTFISNPDNKPEVNHKDGNKQNNYINNLEWSTRSENEKHAWKNNLKNQDNMKNPCCKLTNDNVLVIHGLYLGGMKQIEIGIILNTCNQNISKILSGKTRGNII